MSNRASQIILLCEDKLHEVFVRRFLKAWGVVGLNYKIYVKPYPESSGCGSQFVISNFPDQLTAIRSRRDTVKVLIVVIDADNKTVEERKRELEKTLEEVEPKMSKVAADEHVCCVIPKWSIDTWLAYLQDGNASEDESCKNSLRFRNRESEAHPLIDMLAEKCKQRKALVGSPDSLLKACKEFERIRDALVGL